jgi:hypothetical protein
MGAKVGSGAIEQVENKIKKSGDVKNAWLQVWTD